jgi:hypothetical protein
MRNIFVNIFHIKNVNYLVYTLIQDCLESKIILFYGNIFTLSFLGVAIVH